MTPSIVARGVKRVRLVAGLGVFAAFVMSCSLLTDPLPSSAVRAPMVERLPYAGSFTYTVDPGTTPRDVYFVFTNASTTDAASSNPSVAGATITINGRTIAAPAPQPLAASYPNPANLRERIAEFNRDPWKYARAAGAATLPAANAVSGLDAASDSDGSGVSPGNLAPASQAAFWVADLATGAPTSSVNATCRYHRVVALPDGRQRALSIWVDNTNWAVGGTNEPYGPSAGTVLVDQTMVDTLAAKFLDGAASGDIYRWDTAVLGEPWGPNAAQFSNLIPWDANNTITILLTNLNPIADYSSGSSVMVGYFWSKDNFTSASLPGSNQRIMFYIDATLFATPGASAADTSGTWASTDYWPETVYSTLAHEFQHMIQFYQKQITYDTSAGADTWINEMCSMIMEDLVADKLGVAGPRGVDNGDGSPGAAGNTEGRIPLFNEYASNSLAVAQQPFDLVDYSVAYAFGAWLARNYGGAELLHRIVDSPETNSTAIVDAVAQATGRQESLETLLARWAASVLLSGSTSAPPQYQYDNGGWFTSSAGGITYDLGSIDFASYSPALTVQSAAGSVPPGSFNQSSNVYFKAATSLSAPTTWTLTVPPGVLMSVVMP